MDHKYLKNKLNRIKKGDILIDPHAELRAKQRIVDLEEVKENIANPRKLVFAEQLKSEADGLEKYKCYFSCSKTQTHIYIIKINQKIIVKTIIKINKRWQKRVEKYGKF